MNMVSDKITFSWYSAYTVNEQKFHAMLTAYLHKAENCICRGTQLNGVRSILLT